MRQLWVKLGQNSAVLYWAYVLVDFKLPYLRPFKSFLFGLAFTRFYLGQWRIFPLKNLKSLIFWHLVGFVMRWLKWVGMKLTDAEDRNTISLLMVLMWAWKAARAFEERKRERERERERAAAATTTTTTTTTTSTTTTTTTTTATTTTQQETNRVDICMREFRLTIDCNQTWNFKQRNQLVCFSLL